MTTRPLSIAALLRVLSLTACALTACALAACGKTGPLEQPAPLFGAKAKANYEAQQKAEAEARAAKKAEPQPQSTDPTDQPLTQAPNAEAIPGRSDPFGQAPAGALPNPGTAPNQ